MSLTFRLRVHRPRLLDLPDEILQIILLALPKYHQVYSAVDRTCKRLHRVVDKIWEAYYVSVNNAAFYLLPAIKAEKRSWRWLAQAYTCDVDDDSTKLFEIGYREVTGQFSHPEEGDTYYAGEFHLGLPNGLGLQKTRDCVSIGYFIDGYLNGNGIQWVGGIKKFTGVFHNGQPFYGERQEICHPFEEFPRDRHYIGFFDKYEPCGMGVFLTSDGIVYEGGVLNGEMHGLGRLMHRDGSVYEGHFKSDSARGPGKMTWPNGIVFVGESTMNDLFTRGTFTYPSGCSYSGEVDADTPHGKGTFLWPDKSMFRGKFSNGYRQSGVLVLPTGEVTKQDWGTEPEAMIHITEYPPQEIGGSRKRKADAIY